MTFLLSEKGAMLTGSVMPQVGSHLTEHLRPG